MIKNYINIITYLEGYIIDYFWSKRIFDFYDQTLINQIFNHLSDDYLEKIKDEFYTLIYLTINNDYFF